jgi:glycosyltransferase involved in cell wall biosynthesis
MISVVIPLYNKGESVAIAIESVLVQDGVEFEIVVVNDGSTDSSGEVAQKFADGRIRIVHQSNQGVSAARNKGVALARADLIAFLDADDYFLPGHLARIQDVAEKFPTAALICCSGFAYLPDGSVYVRSAEKYEVDQIVNYFENPYFFTHTSAMAVRKAEFLAVGGYPEAMADNEDLVLSFKMALSHDVAFSPRPLSVYNYSPSRRRARLMAQGLLTNDNGDIDPALIDRYNCLYPFWAALNPSSERTQRSSAFLEFAAYDLSSQILGAFNAGRYADAHTLSCRVDSRLIDRLALAPRVLYKAIRRTSTVSPSPLSAPRRFLIGMASASWTRLGWRRRRARGYPDNWRPWI